MPFGIPQYVHGLTSVPLCVPFIFADSKKCRFGDSTSWLPFITEIVRICHSGYFGGRGAFCAVLDSCCCVVGWAWCTAKRGGYFTFLTIIDIIRARGTISFCMCGLQRWFSNSS